MKHPTSKFKFGTVTNAAIEAFFQNSYNLKEMYTFMLKYNTRNTEEGVKKVLNKSVFSNVHIWSIAVFRNFFISNSKNFFSLDVLESDNLMISIMD